MPRRRPFYWAPNRRTPFRTSDNVRSNPLNLLRVRPKRPNELHGSCLPPQPFLGCPRPGLRFFPRSMDHGGAVLIWPCGCSWDAHHAMARPIKLFNPWAQMRREFQPISMMSSEAVGPGFAPPAPPAARDRGVETPITPDPGPAAQGPPGRVYKHRKTASPVEGQRSLCGLSRRAVRQVCQYGKFLPMQPGDVSGKLTRMFSALFSRLFGFRPKHTEFVTELVSFVEWFSAPSSEGEQACPELRTSLRFSLNKNVTSPVAYHPITSSAGRARARPSRHGEARAPSRVSGRSFSLPRAALDRRWMGKACAGVEIAELAQRWQQFSRNEELPYPPL